MKLRSALANYETRRQKGTEENISLCFPVSVLNVKESNQSDHKN
jgi:hypothetical protein